MRSALQDMVWGPSSRVSLPVCLSELIGKSLQLSLSKSLYRGADWCPYRDLTIAPSRCINKQAFYLGNGVMNIISKS